jgi:hypothetical protein
VEPLMADNGTATEWRVDMGIDISEYQESVEFDLLTVVGVRHEKRYTCCDYPYVCLTVSVLLAFLTTIIIRN